MKILLDTLKPYGFNERPLTETDFFNICEKENIEIIWSDKKYSFFFSALGERCIVLPKRLRGLKLLFAMYHELAHALLSPGNLIAVEWKDMHDERDEWQCDAMALIALMPVSKLRELAWLDGSRYGAKLFNDRCRLYFLFGV